MHATKTILKVRHTRLIFTQFYTIYLRTSFFTKAVFFLRLESNLLKKDSSGRFSTFIHIWYIAEKYIRDEKKTTQCHIYDKSENKTRLLQSKIIKFQDNHKLNNRLYFKEWVWQTTLWFYLLLLGFFPVIFSLCRIFPDILVGNPSRFSMTVKCSFYELNVLIILTVSYCTIFTPIIWCK